MLSVTGQQSNASPVIRGPLTGLGTPKNISQKLKIEASTLALYLIQARKSKSFYKQAMGRKIIQLVTNELRPSSSDLLNSLYSTSNICSSCLLAFRVRSSLPCTPSLQSSARHASTSTAAAPSPSPSPTSSPTVSYPTSSSAHSHALFTSPYRIKTGIILSRPPQITRDLTPFEKAFYFYQRRLNERLALPFTRYFYFEKNTPADLDFKRKARKRLGTAARDIGMYSTYGKEAWNDELLVGAQESEPSGQIKALLRDADLEVEEQIDEEEGSARETVRRIVEVERPEERETEADRKGDVESLNRALQRTLYLVVKGKDGRWVFPAGTPEGRESLHRAAERILVQSGGINMNTWVVGNAPVGHLVDKPAGPEVRPEGEAEKAVLGEKTFFMKARIMAGQFDLRANKFGLTGYKWLAKEELEKEVEPSYWKAVRNMLVDR